MQVRDIMTPKVDLVDPATLLVDAAKIMRDDDVGALPIGRDDRLVGMLSDRDIVIRGIADSKFPQTTTAGDVMSPGVLYCYDDQDVEEAAAIMSQQHVRRLPVVNRDKRLVGIVSFGDLWAKDAPAAAAETLQEISRAE